MFTVIVADKAETDMRRNALWWKENRSAEQAERWYQEIAAKIRSLTRMPHRCPLAPEASVLGRPVRHLLFGLSSRPTHRVLFIVDGKTVYVLRVLHTSQAAIAAPDELRPEE